MFFRSLKKEILIFTLGLTIITIIAMTAIGVSSTQTAGEAAAGATSATLREQAQDFLTQIAMAAAAQQDLLFERIKNNTSIIASYDANIYDNPLFFSHGAYWNFDRRIRREKGRYLNAVQDISTVHIPNFVLLNEREKNNIELSANLDFIVPSILKSSPDTVAVYTIDTQGVTRYFPNIVLGSIAPVDYDPRPDIYYKPATPAENPERKIVWSPLYDDVAGRGLMITATAPIYDKDGFAGIAATDVLLSNIIKTITAYSPIEGSYAFLVDKNGETVAFPDKAYRDILSRTRSTGEVRTDLAHATSTAEFKAVLKDMTAGAKGFGSIHSRGKELFIAYAPLPQTGFSMAVVAQAGVMLKVVETLDSEISGSVRDNITTRVLPASVFIIFLASLISVVLVTRIVKPIQELTKGAEEIGKGNFDYRLQIRNKNEIGKLAISFNQMSQALSASRRELQEYSQSLERKVEERTQELTDANQQQTRLLRFIGHEVKGYLTKAQGVFANITEGDYAGKETALKALSASALGEMRQGVETVKDIMDASNLRSGKMIYGMKRFDLKDAVSAVIEELKPHADEKRLTLNVIVEPVPFLFFGDEEKMAQHIIRNLIDNAIRYSATGTITVELTHERNKIRFSVQDQGVGISPEDMARLFTEGGRGKDSTATNAESTGYGLFIAKQVVSAHGGSIWAESQGAGKGARFIVELPVIADAA